MKSRFDSIKGTELHEKNKEKRKEKRCNAKNNVKKEGRIKAFKNLIRDGPMYICVCCNRCLYKRSVIFFFRR